MKHMPGTDRTRRIGMRFAIVLCLAVALVAIPGLAFGLPVTTCNPSATYSNSAAISITATTGADVTTYLGTRYRFDSAALTTISAYPATATVTQANYGPHTISFFSVDASGGVEATQTKSFTVNDTLKPSTFSDVSVVYLNAATIKLTATDTVGGSGVAATRYQLDSGAVTIGTSVSASGYGDHTLKYWSTDVAGNSEATWTVTFFVDDTIKPTTISDVSATYLNSATIHLSPSDSLTGTGVAHTYYSLDGATVAEGLTINVAAYGSHSLQFWSVDGAGNTESAVTVSFFIDDSIAPVTTSDAAAAYTTSAHITLSATDTNGSGVAHTNYNLDGAGFVSGTSVSVSTLGAHTLQFYSVDNEGNAEVAKTASFNVNAAPGDDTTPPSTSSDAAGTYGASPATIRLTATELAGSTGVASLSYKLDGGSAVVVTPGVGIKASANPPITSTVPAPSGHAFSGTAGTNTACAMCHTVTTAPPITATVSAPTDHAGAPCTACHAVSAAPDITTSDVAPAGHATLACTTCHTVTTDGGGGGGSEPLLRLATDVVVSGDGVHTLEFWATDVAGNEEGHHTVSFQINPAAADVSTSITIVRSASSVRRGGSFTLSGVVTPAGLLGTNVQCMVQKPGRGYYSYSSLRTVYSNAGTPSWWYRYQSLRTMTAGTYRFKAFVPASPGFLTSTSGVVTVSIR
jgi:hypothetical protein